MAKGQGKQFNQRLKLLYLLDYLLENTDEDHTVKTPDIVEYLVNSAGGYQVLHLNICLPFLSLPKQTLILKETILPPLIFSWIVAISATLSVAVAWAGGSIC